MSSRRPPGELERNKMFTGEIVSNKSKYASNKSIFHKSMSAESKANLKCIN